MNSDHDHDIQTLIERAIAGDGEALSHLLCRCHGELQRRIAGRIATIHRGAFDEEDAIQVTYIEAFMRFEQVGARDLKSFMAWLTAVARNNIRDAVRALERDKRPPRHKQIQASDDSYVDLMASLGRSATTPSRHAARTEAREILETALGKLPPDYEQVVRLYDLQGLSAPQIANEMERSAAAIHMLKARAHDRLAEILGSSAGLMTHTW